MTSILKSLDRTRKEYSTSWKKLSTLKKVSFFGMFIIMSLLTFGALPFVVAVGAGVKFGALIMWPDGVTVSGRSRGTVFARNGIRRNFRMPSNPQTPSQTGARNRFAAFSSLWRTLSVGRLTAWRNTKMERMNRVGAKYTISGKAVYMLLNMALDLIGGVAISAPPVLLGIVSPEISSKPQIKVGTTTITLALSNDDASMAVILRASLPIGSGQTRGTRAIVNITFDSTTYSNTTAWTDYVTRYGYTPVAGDVILLEAYYINNTTGEQSPVSNFGAITVIA